MEGKKLCDAWKYVTRYVMDMKIEDGVRKVVEEYQMYVRERFGKNICVNLLNKEVIKAAKVIQKVAREMGISEYEVIKLQHECWEEIREPLIFERMSDESLVRRRIRKKIDEDRKQGVVVKLQGEDRLGGDKRSEEMEKLVAKCWRDILSIGVMFYIKKKGWLADIAREYWNKLQVADRFRRSELKVEYSVENIVKRWKAEGCPRNLLE